MWTTWQAWHRNTVGACTPGPDREPSQESQLELHSWLDAQPVKLISHRCGNRQSRTSQAATRRTDCSFSVRNFGLEARNLIPSKARIHCLHSALELLLQGSTILGFWCWCSGRRFKPNVNTLCDYNVSSYRYRDMTPPSKLLSNYL